MLGFEVNGQCPLKVDTLYTGFSPVLSVSRSGFIGRDKLKVVVKSAVVSGRSELFNWTIGKCPLQNVDMTETHCMEVYDVPISWQGIWDNRCIPVLSETIGNWKEYVLAVTAKHIETLSDLRTLERLITETIAFRVSVPLSVTVTVGDQKGTAQADLHFRAAVMSQSFDLDTFTGTVVLRTKVNAPYVLKDPVASNQVAGLHPTIALMPNQTVGCSPPGDCSQEWIITIDVDKESGVCRLDDAYNFIWNVTCYDACGELEPAFLEVDLTSTDFCGEVVDNVTIDSTMMVFADANRTVQKDSWSITGRDMAFFQTNFSSPESSILETHLRDLHATLTQPDSPIQNAVALMIAGNSTSAGWC